MSPSTRSPWLAASVLCAGVLMVILDGTIVTVALPSIQADLGLSPSGLAWVVNAYLVAFGGLLLLAGRLGDRYGGARVFVAGLVLFTLASLLCGMSATPAQLVAARFAQGVGGALASSVSLGMLVTLFDDPRDRARAIGAFSFVGAAGAAAGLALGGLLTQAVGWHWIFLVNVPVGLAATAVSLAVLDRAPSSGAVRIDLLGAVLVTGGLMALVAAIVGTDRYGWLAPRTAGLALAAAVLLTGFAVRQVRGADPLLPVRVLRSPGVAAANVVQLLMVAALFGFQVLVALFLQQVLGYGAAETGLAMLPAALVIGAVSLVVSAPLIARFGERAVLGSGLVLLVATLGLLTRLPAHAHYAVDVLPVMLLAGGFGLALPALTSLAMSGATAEDAGLASGLFSTTQQVGGALGLAVMTSVAATRSGHLRGTGVDRLAALTGGFHAAFGIGTGLLVLALATALWTLRSRRAETRTAAVAREPATADCA
jgi:EmrB/QacA subfamily drug resistance transporter